MFRQLWWMSTIGVNAQLQPSARDSRPPTRPIWYAASVSGVDAVCSGVATRVPSLQAPLPPASMLDATSSGTFDRAWACRMCAWMLAESVWLYRMPPGW